MDVINAKDVATLLRHLPPDLADAVTALPPATQKSIAEPFLISARLRQEGMKATHPDSGPLLVLERTVGDETREEAEIYLDRRLTDGEETLLRFRVEPKNIPDDGELSVRDLRVSIGMRFVDDEWRVYEVDGGPAFRLDDPKLLDRFVHERDNASQGSAVGSMRTLNTALITYASVYPEIGLPASLEVLGGDGGSPDHAGLVDSVLGSPPFQTYGYRFTYHRLSQTEYTISGRPVDTSASSTARSFFTDQSGVIRFTQEDRDATANDPPLQ